MAINLLPKMPTKMQTRLITIGWNALLYRMKKNVYFNPMKSPDRPLLVFLLFLAIISVFYLLGVSQVPFHPDESTQLFTSGDAELFWQQPGTLFWQPDREDDRHQLYRELDAPLTRNLIALGRWVSGQPALPVDWDWSKTWEENRQAGALPTSHQLQAARMAVAALYPLSVLILFLTVRRVTNTFTAWTAALLLAGNALVLLHTRRAMAEGALLFTTTLSLWSLVKAEKHPWLTAVPLALAFCAKQTLAALSPIGLLAVLWQPDENAEPGRKNVLQITRQALIFGACMLLIIALLHPYAWQRPVQAIQAAIQSRQSLANAQTSDRPEQTLNTPAEKLIGLLGSLYLTPPITAEVSNYTQYTREAEAVYLSNPLHSLLRSLPAGGFLLVLGLFGFILAARQFFTAEPIRRRRLGLLMGATLLQTLAILALIALPWQRYYMPLVPFCCIWTAYGLNELIRLGSLRRGSAGPAHRAAHLPGK